MQKKKKKKKKTSVCYVTEGSMHANRHGTASWDEVPFPFG
jgi:hypothetical protein